MLFGYRFFRPTLAMTGFVLFSEWKASVRICIPFIVSLIHAMQCKQQ